MAAKDDSPEPRGLVTYVTPPELLIYEEERACVEARVAILPPDEQKILYAYANTVSQREAAKSLGMHESIYRREFHGVITKIQPPTGLAISDGGAE